jgi:hypothetical protein
LFIAFLAASSCSRPPNHADADATRIEGVSARFQVSSRVRRGDNLKVMAIYRNESDKTIMFHYTAAAIYDSEIWHGKQNRTNCMLAAEIPAFEVALKPREEVRAPDELPIEGACFEVGDYKIRFYYKLSLLLDGQLRAQYASKYPVRDGAIPWESHGHLLEVK